MTGLRYNKLIPMKNAELKALLKERDLLTTGKKAEMVARLEADDEAKAAGGAETGNKAHADAGASTAAAAGGGAAAAAATATGAAPPSSSSASAAPGIISMAAVKDDAADPMSLEARKARAARFGVPVKYTPEEEAMIKLRELEELEAKRKARAERFGTEYKPLPETLAARRKAPTIGPKPVLDAAAIKARAARFGTELPKELADKEEAELRRKRKERFGTSVAPSAEPLLKKAKGL
ncbi:uncharacterized protein AMSG_08339 [Thecamonas trahens ATCC 50062]|uniref:SAP domain-containing protein n=1 Tax=Thecamonas trahens ATCC 50062 TaxID=461836 RepID=A0A0L0DLV2_THETB|nr:hypothetical protein AMSG_08339 [Thecamonas trahens ATCC 50062]KNC52368.1 hypothetical protein AMSG_08339 [Thecamonas trahens ATCC 50062]|eukprot:XP_013755415.1 hypothetical protein AMSG_08339 [Thecamonas trahens ATCC 50062]